jgi:hypothetical protein
MTTASSDPELGPNAAPVGAAAAAPTAKHCSAQPTEDRSVVPPPAGEGLPGMSQRHRATEATAVILAGDLLRWIIPKVGRFPRQVRHGLGARIEAAHLDVLEHLGFVLCGGQRRLARAGVVRATRRLRGQAAALAQGAAARSDIWASLAAWRGHAGHATSPELIPRVLSRSGLGWRLTHP